MRKSKEKQKLQKHMCRNVALTFLGHIQYYILTLCSILVSVEWCSKTVVNCWGNKEDFPWSQLVLLYSNISALDCQITVIPLLSLCYHQCPDCCQGSWWLEINEMVPIFWAYCHCSEIESMIPSAPNQSTAFISLLIGVKHF